MLRRLIVVTFIWIVCGITYANTTPTGGEFQVNSYTTGRQRSPSVATGPTGDFVVVWDSGQYGVGPDASSASIQGQLFSSDGAAVGGEFIVNSYTTNNQLRPDIAGSPGGSFVATWHSFGSTGQDKASFSIQYRRLDSDGTAIGEDFQVNTYTTANQYRPVVATGAAGDFLIVWHSLGSDGDDLDERSIQGRLFSSDGTAVGDDFQVNTYVTGNQYYPAVAADKLNGFVVVWASAGSSGTDSDRRSIQGQRLASDGSKVGLEFQVNTYTTNYQTNPAVAVRPNGDFVVVWDSYGSTGSDSSGYSIQARRFHSDGTAEGEDFQINSSTLSFQVGPVVTFNSDNVFTVVWEDLALSSIQAQQVSWPDGLMGPEFQVNTISSGYQYNPEIASGAGAPGDMVIVWDSDSSGGDDSDDRSVQGQQFLDVIFADGFESGDAAAWSAEVP